MDHDLSYRLLREVDDLRQVVNLQRLVWGDDPEAQVPLNVLYSLAVNGSPIIGAFDGDLLVGFSLAFFSLDHQDSSRPAIANLKLASKRLAVHPDYRSSGIGFELKIEQKAFANQQGVRLITWTFDPHAHSIQTITTRSPDRSIKSAHLTVWFANGGLPLIASRNVYTASVKA
jgi:predicted GNAT superfamily acetyltransferase